MLSNFLRLVSSTLLLILGQKNRNSSIWNKNIPNENFRTLMTQRTNKTESTAHKSENTPYDRDQWCLLPLNVISEILSIFSNTDDEKSWNNGQFGHRKWEWNQFLVSFVRAIISRSLTGLLFYYVMWFRWSFDYFISCLINCAARFVCSTARSHCKLINF